MAGHLIEGFVISQYLLGGAIAPAAGPRKHCPLGLSEQEAAERMRLKRLRLQSLPPDVHPHIVEMAVPLSEGGTPDLYDTFGADLLMAGIEALSARPGGH